jgi:Mycothiol maleylpyruvate isomerase N-terminal domain
MIELDLAVVTAADGRNLLSAAQTDWLRPIPHCPGWDAADLVGHMGSILGWMARIVTTGEPVARADRESPPAGHLAPRGLTSPAPGKYRHVRKLA